MTAATITDPNTLFPGRPYYVGPTVGVFGLLHHEQLCETSHDVMERVAYVEANKPPHERKIRLHNMIYLGGCEAVAKRTPLAADYNAKLAAIDADYNAKRAPLDADYYAKRAPLDADYKAKLAAIDAEIEAYIRRHIPDCAWNGETLVFPSLTTSRGTRQ